MFFEMLRPKTIFVVDLCSLARSGWSLGRSVGRLVARSLGRLVAFRAQVSDQATDRMSNRRRLTGLQKVVGQSPPRRGDKPSLKKTRFCDNLDPKSSKQIVNYRASRKMCPKKHPKTIPKSSPRNIAGAGGRAMKRRFPKSTF